MVEKKVRYRANVSMTSTGKMGFDCTVESDGMSMDEVLKESDQFVSELKKRYELIITTGDPKKKEG